jgi:predicted nucleic acid-binding protein
VKRFACLEVTASAILLDDDPARKLAGQLGLPVIGTAGVLLLAKERQLIPAVRPSLDALIENRFFLAQTVYELILTRAGEI